MHPHFKNIAISIAVGLALAFGAIFFLNRHSGESSLPVGGSTEFKAPSRTPDLSSHISNNLAAAQPPVDREIPPVNWPAVPTASGNQPLQGGVDASNPEAAALQEASSQAEQMQGDPVMGYLARYGTPVTKQSMPVGGLTQWTVMSKTGKPVKLYTTADGKALVSGVVWDLETGRNVSDAPMAALTGIESDIASKLPQVVAPKVPVSNLVSGMHALPSAFDGKAPTQIPDAIKLVDELAGYKEGKGGPQDTLYIIIDPRCPYCRKAYLSTREHVKNGATIKWIPTSALGNPEQGIPLSTTILRSNNPDTVARVLGGHEKIATPPTDFEVKQLANNLEFMFEAFKQNNEPNPGVPVAFFIDRRSGKARMMMGLSEQVVIDDILGNPKK